MEKIIQFSFELNCPIKMAFQFFTQAEKLELWLTEKAEIELKVGGKYELFWDPKERNKNSTLGCKITGIEKYRYLSFNWKGPEQFEQFMNSADPLTHVIIFIYEKKEKTGISNILFLHTGWRNTEQWEEARNYFEKAWSMAFKRLKEVVKGIHFK